MTERPGGFWVRVATLGPVGAFPFAPGTLGAGVGVGLVAILHCLPLRPNAMSGSTAGLAAVIYALGISSAGRAEKAFGVVDPGHVVIDEVAGQAIAFVFRPTAGWAWLLTGFLVFRFFDILKPFPAGRLERLPEGWGVMTDDVMAGFYTALTLYLAGLLVR